MPFPRDSMRGDWHPAGMTTVVPPGSVALGLLLDTVTLSPPLGAGPLTMTVAVLGEPPITVGGDRDILDSDGGLTVRVAETVAPARVAVMCAVVDVETQKVIARIPVPGRPWGLAIRNEPKP